MFRALQLSVAGAALVLAAAPGAATAAPARPQVVASAAGVVRLRSTHGVADTAARIKAVVEAKGIRFFDMIDQQALGAGAALKVQPSTLVLFGNPPLGVQFLQSNRYAGLDWPVRMLVTEEADGSVWLAWTDFGYIAKRYGITNREAQFKMASEVALMIATEAAN